MLSGVIDLARRQEQIPNFYLRFHVVGLEVDDARQFSECALPVAHLDICLGELVMTFSEIRICLDRV